ncbi:creatinine amidohydrolase [Haloprofundus marisrubri]|uniref:Creatinine amidohydrolase n=2 Tax=Haloprofundus marisrubri TaxID=1514971 RepID=A0A0W1RDE4_9EURY|nr:creatinine amidohydrolase [Haloprofundus marisrubri]
MLSPAAWATKTRLEISEVATADGSVAVIPVGSIEQHGHHLPVATDTFLADAVSHHGAERVIDDFPILVTPPVWTGYSPHHMSLGGTLTVELTDLLDVLTHLAESAIEHGFDAICFVNGHGGNASLVDNTVSVIGKEHSEVEVTGVTYFSLAASFIDNIRESELGGMAHGGEFETSLMLHLYPELVKEDAPAEYLEDPYDHGGKDLVEGGPLSSYRPFEDFSDSGAIGDPSLASAEKGEEIMSRLGDELETIFQQIHDEAK